MKKKIFLILLIFPSLLFAQLDWGKYGQIVNGDLSGDHAGSSLATNLVGDIVALGAWENDDNGSQSGKVRVFQLVNNIWTQIGSDINGDAAGDNSARYGLAMSDDGSIIAISSSESNINGWASGQVRVFENISGVWIQKGTDIVGNAGDEIGVKALIKEGGGDTVSSSLWE